MLCGLTQVNQALGEDNLLRYDCDAFGHGLMVINLSHKKIYFLGGVITIIDAPQDQNEFHAFFEDDEQNVELSLKDFNPHLDSPASSFSFTWSINVRNGSEELVRNNYTEGFCTLISLSVN